MKKMNYFRWTLLGFVLISVIALAQTQGASLGDVASTLFSGGMQISAIIRDICIITGIALIFASFLQYKKHRNNPSEVPLSTVFMSLIAGLALLALAFIPIQLAKS